MNNWEIRLPQGVRFYQDRITFEGTFNEAIEFAKERYAVIRKTVAVHRPRDPYAYYWINNNGEVNRNQVGEKV